MVLSPLELPGWLEFNTWRTGLTAHRYDSPTDGRARVAAVLYLDRRGRIVLPPNNPYLFIGFETTSTRPSSRTSEWLRLGGALVDDMRRRGVADMLHLPPGIVDVRPWSWNGFAATVRYTYVIDFPQDESAVPAEVRRRIARSGRLGLTAERTDDVDLAWPVMSETEGRAGFSHGIDLPTLRRAATILGDHLRMYVCRDAHGRAVAAEIRLHAPGARAIGWIAGATADGQAQRAGPYLRRFVYDDLAASGATGIDLCGANIPAVAAYKASAGGRLQPTYDVRPYSARSAVRHALDAMHANRARRERRASSGRSKPDGDAT